MECHIFRNAPFEVLLKYGNDTLALAVMEDSFQPGYIPLVELKKYLVYATQNTAVKCMEYLIKRQAPFTVDIRTEYPDHGILGTALSIASEKNCLPGVDLLLRSQRIFAMYDPDCLNYALAIAIQKRNIPMMVKLIGHRAWFDMLIATKDLDNVPEPELPPLSYAVECNDLALLRYLSKHIALEETGRCYRSFVSPFVRAVRKRNFPTIYEMLKIGWTVNPVKKRQPLPLGEAASRGDTEMVEFLVDNFADINATDRCGLSALDHALLTGGEQTTDIMLSYFPKITEMTFHAMIWHGSVDGLRRLLQKGQYMERYLKALGLCVAIDHESEELVRVFLEQPRIRMRNTNTGRHALICAVQRDNLSITRMLLQVGKSPEVTFDQQNFNPEISAAALHIAISRRNIDMVQLLLSFGAKLNTHSSMFSSSALNSALRTRDIELIRLLLVNGSNANAASETGETIIDAALKTGCDEVVVAVLEYGGDRGKIPAAILPRIEVIERRNAAMRWAAGLGSGWEMGRGNGNGGIETRDAPLPVFPTI